MRTPPDAAFAALQDYYDAEPEPAAAALADVRRRALARVTVTANGVSDAGARSRPGRAGRGRAGRRAVRTILPAGLAAAAVVGVAVAMVTAVLPARTSQVTGAPQPGGSGASSDAGAPGPGATVGDPVFFSTISSRAVAVAPIRVDAAAYVYSKTRSVVVTEVRVGNSAGANGSATDGGQVHVVSETLTETWASTQGLAPVRQRQTINLDVRPLTAADAATLGGRAASLLPVRTIEMAGSGTRTAEPRSDGSAAADMAAPTPAYLATLPTDPTRLRSLIRTRFGSAGGKWSADQMTFEVAGRLLATADAVLPSALRSALYRVLGSIPGVLVLPDRVVLAGHKGVALTRTESGIRQEVIVDPVSTRALGLREIAVHLSGLPAGTTLSSTTVLQRQVTKVGATS